MSNYNWSAPELLDPYNYANSFGEVILTPVTEFMPISEIAFDRVSEIKDVLVTIEEAEQVTLITENYRGMMSFCFPLLEGRTCYALQYSCRNRAAVCSVEIRKFHTPRGISAQEQIEAMAPKYYGVQNVGGQ